MILFIIVPIVIGILLALGNKSDMKWKKLKDTDLEYRIYGDGIFEVNIDSLFRSKKFKETLKVIKKLDIK